MTLDDMRRAWAARRDEWRRLAVQVDGARLCDDVLEALDQLAMSHTDAVSLAEASRITGRTPDHLGRMIRRRQLPNAGRKHRPLIPRAALAPLGKKHGAPDESPVEPIAPVAPEAATPYNVAADARSLLRRRAPGGSHGA